MNSGKIKVTKDGPYLVSGRIPLSTEIAAIGESNEPETWKKGREFPEQEMYSLCRCGNSSDKPFCDGTHVKIGFDGTETAGYKKYADQARMIKGPEVDLTDAEKLCSVARFCHKGNGTWGDTINSDNTESKRNAIETSCNCPSGRLVAWDKDGNPIEPKFKPSVSLTQDPQRMASGPVWVKGGITIESSEGKQYEIRNRVTLCRCGNSGNKPFCDASHLRVKFNDGDESLK